GDRQAALQDFETLEREVDDPGVRLELAKLYEHHLKAYGRAIRVVEQGTTETDSAAQRRKARLRRKIARANSSSNATEEQASLPLALHTTKNVDITTG
ncbi:MAG TPA: hypothetical protein PK140_25635, partial [Polyangiaceae bacterium]|nr:hypothetical protein [Polyangiaceae bacterium]